MMKIHCELIKRNYLYPYTFAHKIMNDAYSC